MQLWRENIYCNCGGKIYIKSTFLFKKKKIEKLTFPPVCCMLYSRLLCTHCNCGGKQKKTKTHTLRGTSTGERGKTHALEVLFFFDKKKQKHIHWRISHLGKEKKTYILRVKSTLERGGKKNILPGEAGKEFSANVWPMCC